MPAFSSPFGTVSSTPHVDLDLSNGSLWSSPYNPTNPLTVVRNSVAYMDTYTVNGAYTWDVVPANQARVTNRGLLVEEGRTNYIRNNSMQGAIAGTPGTLPTNWSSTIPTGLNRTIILGTQNGMDYIQFRWFGTTTAAGTISVDFETTTAIPMTIGGVNLSTALWPFSCWVNRWGFDGNGLATGIGSVNLVLKTDGGFQSLGANIRDIGGGLSVRSSVIAAPTNGSNIRGGVVTNSINSGTAVDLTLQIAWPQIETPIISGGVLLGGMGSVSSPIRTTGSAFTRQADVIKLTAPPKFGTNYTFYAQGTPSCPTTYPDAQNLVTLTDLSGAEFALQREATTGKPGWRNNTTNVAISATAWAINATGEIAGAVSPNAQAGNFNGGSNATGTATTTALTGSTIWIGSSGANPTANDGFFNGYITRVTIWSQTRLDDAQLPNLTGAYFPELGFSQNQNQFSFIQVALSSETLILNSGPARLTLRAPHALKITAVTSSLSAVGVSPTIVDVKVNGVSIFSTNKLQIDYNSRTSVGSTVTPIIINPYVSEDDEITFDVNSAGLNAIGLKATIKGILT